MSSTTGENSNSNTASLSTTSGNGGEIVLGNSSKKAFIPKQGATKNVIWQYFKLLSDDDPNFLQHQHTHQCTLCETTLKVNFVLKKNSLNATYRIVQPERHLLACHADLPCVQKKVEIKKENESQKRKTIATQMGQVTAPAPKMMKLNTGIVSISCNLFLFCFYFIMSSHVVLLFLFFFSF